MGHDRRAGRFSGSVHGCASAVRVPRPHDETITMARISTHVLDVALGRPAAGIPVELHRGLVLKAETRTNADGRTDSPLVSLQTLEAGDYDLTFHVGDYFRAQGIKAFYEVITIGFLVEDGNANYHVPLLLAPHGYSTYRGS